MTTPTTAAPLRSRKRPLGLLLVLFVTVLAVFITWRSTWFGAPLDDDALGSALHFESKPRKIQHGLEQLAVRILEHPGGPAGAVESISAFHDLVAALRDHPAPEIRRDAAYTMGLTAVPAWHDALLALLRDQSPLVRRNAAFSLSKFRDDAGRSELLACLVPAEVTAPVSGILEYHVAVDDPVSSGRALAVIKVGEEEHAIQPRFQGRILTLPVSSGTTVAAGDVVFTVSPDPTGVQNALIALQLVGRKEDGAHLRPYLDGRYPGMPDRVRGLAQATDGTLRLR